MQINVGVLDRTFRLLLAAILWLALRGGGEADAWRLFLDFALFWMLVTGVFRVCPIYSLAQFDSCAKDR